eukprot:TRINITY_DN4740_c0_g1_i1.p1 TRINITY_DN4740_c0_g1~~TRINITY_DN4740_c0_g1_i1.p1  ORF type:complete len:329 (-),score=63.64 TRINITY_DN4740_c0_g1_i1:197-1183(-)
MVCGVDFRRIHSRINVWCMSLMSDAEPYAMAIARKLGFLLVCFAVAIMSGIIYTHYALVLPYHEFSMLVNLAHVIFSSFLIMNVLFNYGMATWTSAGVVQKTPFTEEDQRRLEKDGRTPNATSWYCFRCRNKRPERAHHCQICGVCVMKMDHHCPWINGCVGHHNHRYFALFLVFLSVAMAYEACMSFLPFWDGATSLYETVGVMMWTAEDTGVHAMFTFVFLCCSVAGCGVAGLCIWQVYLASINLTTVEYYISASEKRTALSQGIEFGGNKFDLGWKKNLRFFFGVKGGDGVFWSALLPTFLPPLGDGIQYPSRGGDVDVDGVFVV